MGTDDCHLIFAPTTDMFVHYPNQETCCRVCPVGVGCTPLNPSWLQNSTYEGTEIIEGTECQVYYQEGAVAKDYWMETVEGTPCRYYESLPKDFPLVFHNITFFPETYSTEAIPDYIFDVPDYCYQDCPKPCIPPDPCKYEHVSTSSIF